MPSMNNQPSGTAPHAPSAGQQGSTTAPKPKKSKKNFKLDWTNKALSDGIKPWRIDVEKVLTSGGVVYRWNGVYFDAVGADGRAALALQWIRATDPEAFDPGLAEKCHKALALSLRMSRQHSLPQAANAVIPLTDAYLEIDGQGAIVVRKPDPKYGMTYAVDITTGKTPGQKYMPKALPARSKFRAFLDHAQPNQEVQALLQELCGATLLQNNYGVASWNHGAAGSGKSTLAELCLKMQRSGASTRLGALADRFELEKLIGASFVYVDEVDSGERVPEGKLKTLISQNTISVDRKNEKGVSTKIRAKWMICSNDKPFIRDKSDGVWRRLCVIEWRYPIPEGIREQDYHEVLWKEEANLILDWMIEGAVRLVRRGRFMTEAERPREVQLTKEYAREESDSIRAWINANSVERVDDRAQWQPKTRIYAAYRTWCENQDIPLLEPNVFWRGLRPKLNLENDYQRAVPGQGQKPHQGVKWTIPGDEFSIPMASAAQAPLPVRRSSVKPVMPPIQEIIAVPMKGADPFVVGLMEDQA